MPSTGHPLPFPIFWLPPSIYSKTNLNSTTMLHLNSINTKEVKSGVKLAKTIATHYGAQAMNKYCKIGANEEEKEVYDLVEEHNQQEHDKVMSKTTRTERNTAKLTLSLVGSLALGLIIS